jgi:adenylate kinase family enzyme
VYEKQTQPLIEYYEKKKTKFVTIRNAQVDAPIDLIFQQILDGLKKARVA